MKTIDRGYAVDHLGELLGLVEAGEKVLIADGDRGIAILVPVTERPPHLAVDDADVPNDEVERAFHGD
ncbi:hypothetical protein ABC977_01650 [Thioalkalicoccus limnaeus]|uniref:Prevent-host-death protein n=1 Tax=Thioalkalicoccus limnaeus TaxID=120681 RepID=A0ABV4BBF9_9GAMM